MAGYHMQRWLLVGILSATWAPATVFADTPDIADVFRTALACRLAELVLADAPVSSVYTLDDQACELRAPNADGEGLDPDRLYADASCRVPVPFEATPLGDWCDSLFDRQGLGEGEGLSTDPDREDWTLSPGSRLNLGSRSLDGVTQPWLHRFVYREVDTDAGRCRLEMRVYAPRPIVDGVPVQADDGLPESNGRALIAWHGGSWSNRGFGFFGLELTVPHFTQRGFTVFAPFYRLLEDSEGSAACNSADFESGVVADAHAAFDWVQENASRYGLSGEPVVFGQSAGGQLAARIAADRPDEVASAVLFYAPVDFTDFVQRAQTGLYTDEQGLDIIQRVVDAPLPEIDVSVSPIVENSLPDRVVRDGVELPPMFMLHGDSDVLVESRQSMRLCEAIDGAELTASDVAVPGISATREVFLCGDESSVHRVHQAQHALDVCIASTFFATDLCLAGNETSRAAVSDSIRSAAAFASGTSSAGDNGLLIDDEPPGQDGSQSGASSGGGAGGVVLLILMACGTGLRCWFAPFSEARSRFRSGKPQLIRASRANSSSDATR